MTSKVAESIRRGLEEATVYADGTAHVNRYGIHVPADIHVTEPDLAQEEFVG